MFNEGKTAAAVSTPVFKEGLDKDAVDVLPIVSAGIKTSSFSVGAARRRKKEGRKRLLRIEIERTKGERRRLETRWNDLAGGKERRKR